MSSAVAIGKFVVSLDLELFWGVRDIVNLPQYGENIKGVHFAIPEILKLFVNYEISGTFATVGLLFFENKNELLNNIPRLQPSYHNYKLSPFGEYLAKVGDCFEEDPYHFGLHLVKLIHTTPGQEVASHTFSHYYCLEEGQSPAEFEADLETAQSVANSHGIKLRSIVFPRNQFNETYLSLCAKYGITGVRGNERSWIYEPRRTDHETAFRRLMRLVDSYVSLTGHNCYSDADICKTNPCNINASRFLRPYMHRLRAFEFLRLERIRRSMTYAAKNNLMFHLWWHPHNFGVSLKQNLSFLEKILVHYAALNRRLGFQSYTMSELSDELRHR